MTTAATEFDYCGALFDETDPGGFSCDRRKGHPEDGHVVGSGEDADDLRQQLAAVTAERDGHLEELTHVRGRAIRAEAERDVLTAAVQELVARVGDLERLQDLWAEADAVANARALEVVEERDQLRAMLEECLPGKTADGYDGGLYELALSAECERRDHEPGSERFFASKVRDIHARARALLAEVRGR